MEFSLANILSILSLFIAVVGGALLKSLVGRAFAANDQKIVDLQNKKWVSESTCQIRVEKLDSVEKDYRVTEKEVTRLIEITTTLKELQKKFGSLDKIRADFLEKFVPAPDFARQMQIMVSQIEGIYKKIDHLDQKLDRSRERG